MKTSSTFARWWDLPAASLLVVALVTASTRLVATNWTENLTIVQTLAFFGTVAGLALGYSRFSSRLVTFLAVAYGSFMVPWQMGLTFGRGVEWNERLLSLVGRLEIIINQLLAREVVQDSLLFLVLMSILFWVLGVNAGYTLVRYGSPWRALLPTGIALFAIHSFDALIARRTWYLAVFLFFALVLVARMAYIHQHTRWQRSRTALPPHLGLDFIRFTLLAAGLLVVFSWTVPALASTLPAAEKAFQVIRQPYNEMRDRMDNAFASLKSSVGVVSDYYGTSVLLGRGNALTDVQVFNVRPPSNVPENIRLYWRARTYDSYRDGQWLSTIPTSRAFSPDADSFKFPIETGRWYGKFDFISATYISTLFAPSQPIWVSRPAQAEVGANPDGTVDLTAFRATPSLTPGQVYSVQSSIGNVTEIEMLEAGTEYPEWIEERYLQVPEEVTPRTRELAEQITAGLETPYEKTLAVTQYLRDNIEYSETVPGRPPRQEAIDWFLFDQKQGFCNYYASAEVMLLRIVGVPARWVVGYAQGERLDDGTFTVRQRDSHAWPEVYFPGLGWIEFEPTASQPAIERLAGSPSDLNSDELSAEEQARLEMEEELRLLREDRDLGDGSAAEAGGGGTGYGPLLIWTGSLLAAAGLLFIGWRNRSRFNLPPIPILVESTMLRVGLRPPAAIRMWARRAALPPLAKSYLEINHALSRMGRRPSSNLTPYERASMLGDLIPPAMQPASKLVQEYQVETFSPQTADVPSAREAGAEVRKLSYKALLQRFFARLQKPPRNLRGFSTRNGSKP